MSFKKPYVIYAQSLGPFNSILTKIAAKLAFNLIDLIIAREKITAQYLKNLGVEEFMMGADPAFILPTIKKDVLIKILDNEGIPTDKVLIGINMSQHIYDIIGKRYIKIHAKLIDHLVENLDANVVLIPHVIHEGFDDRSISQLTYSKIKNKGSVKLIKGDYTPEEIKSIIGNFDLFIGGRMHATIASTSMFVPTVGIAYSHKMHGIIGEMLGLEDYIVDLEDLNHEILIEKVMEAWENRERNNTILFDNIGDHKFLFSGYYVSNHFNVTGFRLSFFNRQIFELKKFRILNYTVPSKINGYYGYLFQYNTLHNRIVMDAGLTNTMPIESMKTIKDSDLIYDNGNVKLIAKNV